MTDDKLYTSLSANTIMAKLTNQFQRTRHITSSPDKHYSLDYEDDFRSGCRNVSHQQQFFSELPSPGRSHYTNYWYSWVQTIYNDTIIKCFHDLQIKQINMTATRTDALVDKTFAFSHAPPGPGGGGSRGRKCNAWFTLGSESETVVWVDCLWQFSFFFFFSRQVSSVFPVRLSSRSLAVVMLLSPWD